MACTSITELAVDHILVIDDDVEMCEMLAEYLQSDGLKVETVHDGEKGLERALSGDHSLIVLDVMLPGLNGIELLRRLRAESNARVLLLSARVEEIDRVIGLEVGADDYVSKPFGARELLARIRAILRRPEATAGPWRRPAIIVIGDLEMNTGNRSVERSREEVELTSVEFDLLELLLRNAGQVISREQIAKLVLGKQLFTPALDRSVDMHVCNLRRKLGPFSSGGERIKSQRGVGYMYVRSSQT
jgi:two-component system response regulator CpxR